MGLSSRKAAVHGYNAHVATDVVGGIVRCVEMTPTNVNDSRMLGAGLPSNPGTSMQISSRPAELRDTDQVRSLVCRACPRSPLVAS